MKHNILIVEDDADITELLTLYLDGSDFHVLSAADGEQALRLVKQHPISAALVDVMMPRMNGYEFIRTVRQHTSFPIIIVSARTMDADEVLGLDIGADAYIRKPFNPMVLVAQVRAVLRRAYDLTCDTADKPALKLEVGDLQLDLEKSLLKKRGEIVPLTLSELKIMTLFMKSPGRVYTKAQLYSAVWEDAYLGDENAVNVHISRLRAKVEDDPRQPRYVCTVWGIGYKLGDGHE